MEKKYPEQYYLFFRKFNDRQFYECHDLLEEIWLEDKTNKFLQGLLQLAVGIYHFECGNIKGARWMFGNARKYLSKYTPKHWNLDVNQVIAYIETCLNALPPVDTIPYQQVGQIAFPYRELHLDEG
jgi:predicted metal-dependent hydrolase